ncbi:hypothetical protein AMAG_02640 [Allomyces macrogynus ATCC 38327]|uniref:PQ loop repeat protein n=1 Tax=Allomyces macrogynus (strain ATCC 38327) TaxID=578462 RepID=A0A0L0S376_ALLM3|nr:hypothetical protein AMAG_02640 [Allomyces macrogynus ATCC 38327]|eukprot:KNE56870.1 hypothetical protein AMAG_02640 [Allomyces macrogynus ATCC 38327]
MTNLSTPEVEAIGYVGGVVLALCLAPQIIQVVRTRSAEDISYAWQGLYLVGLSINLAYLVLLGAVAGYVAVIIEIALLLVLVVCKFFFDRKRAQQVRNEGQSMQDERLVVEGDEKSDRLSLAV